MKVVLVLCIAVAVASAGPLSFLPTNLIPLPSSSINYLTLLSSVSSVHSILSNTPLKPFLPSVTEMAMGLYQVVNTSNNMNDLVKRAGDFVANMVRKAGEQAKLPTDVLAQLTSQIQGAFSQFLESAQTAGSQLGGTTGATATSSPTVGQSQS